MGKPLVSIACTTYNHENYIRDAIEGFLMQKTTFPFEIIIHDDASTDATAKTVEQYAQKYPSLIYPIYQKVNQYSQGKKPSVDYAFPKCRGKYIALCEGDDYWTDPLKLQKQVTFLEANEDYMLCAGKSSIRDGNNFQDYWLPKTETITFRDIAHRNFIATNTVVIRNIFKRKNDELGDFYDCLHKVLNVDIFLYLYLLLKGKGYILQDNVGVYRMHEGGIMSKKPDEERYLHSLKTRNTIINYLKNIKIDDSYIKDIEYGYLVLLESYLNNNMLTEKFIETVPRPILNKAILQLTNNYQQQINILNKSDERFQYGLKESSVITTEKEKQKTLSVCFFSHTSQLAGAERSLLELITELIRDHGVTCTVVLPNAGPLKEKLEEAGASTLIAEYSWWCDPSLPPDNEIALRQNNSLISVIEQMTQKLQQINPDVIFTNTMVIPWGAIAASFLGKPHIWSISEFGELDHGFQFFVPFEKIPRIIRDSSNVIITNSKAVKKAVFGDTVEPNILTVYRYIDIAPNALVKDRDYFTKPDSTKLIIASTISESKGQEDAILAVKELIQKGRNIELIIAGYSIERYLKKLKDLVKHENLEGSIKFIDFQKNVYPIMDQADIVLVCSKNEAFGRITLEGMLLKKPIIGTNSGGTPELIKEGFNGLLYEPGDHAQLAEKIDFFLANKKMIKEFGVNGFKFAKKKFTKAEYGGKIYKLIKKLKNERNPLSSNYSQFLLKNILRSFGNLEATIMDKDVHIGNFDGIIMDKDTHISNLETAIKSKDHYIGSLEATLKDKVIQISNLETAIKDKDPYIGSLDKVIQISNLETAIKDKNSYIGSLEATIKDKVIRISNLEDSLREIRPSFSYKAGNIIALPFTAIRDYLELITIFIKDSFLFNKNRLSKFPAEFGFRGYLDNPADNANFVICYGWFASKKPLKRAELFIGGKKIIELERNIERCDVDEAIPGYEALDKKGFEYIIPDTLLSDLKNKKRILFIRFYIDDKHYIDKFHTKVSLCNETTKTLESTRGSLNWFIKIFKKPNKTAFTAHKHVPEKISNPVDFAKTIKINTSQNPLVSIIIPIYGKIDYTLRCLASIAVNTPQAAFEVIVVDDCSPDNSAEVLANINGIRLIRNEKNQGFIRSCNLGASVAQGEYLYFLNNDTEVTPHWADELLRTFQEFPGTGLAGSKLIYPDGLLQEAGGIIWQDGSAWNYGRFQDPSLPIYNYAREVDYCSGASIMVPKTLFEELGRFDEDFLPAYGEDSDLALKIRDHGYRVIYQPLSTIIHYEGITSGTDTSQGPKAHQIENSKKLFERWKYRLQHYQLPGVDLDNAKDRMAKRRVLVLDHCTPTPDQDAGSATVFNLMLLLREMDFQVTFIPEDNFLYMPEYTKALQRVGIEVLYDPYVTSVEQHLKECDDRYHLAFLFRPNVVDQHIKTIRKLCPKAKVLFHTVDLHFLRMSREAELQSDKAKKEAAEKMKQIELAAIGASDASIVHSTAELELLRPEVPDAKLHVFPLIVEVLGTTKAFSERKDIVFIGGYQHTPNVDAVQYFVKEIMPLLRKQLPRVRFYAVGSKPPAKLKTLACEDVIVTGFIEDLTPLLDKMRVSVVPLRYGAGIKGKIGSAMAVGLPMVVTSLAKEGMSLTDGENILVADGAEPFAAAVATLYQDEMLWNRISQNGLAFADKLWGGGSSLEKPRHYPQRSWA